MKRTLLAALFAASTTLAAANELPQQLYAALESGILVLTVEPCKIAFNNPEFAYAAYAVVDFQEEKRGCWYSEYDAVNMVFTDQPGVHTWRKQLFSPVVPVR